MRVKFYLRKMKIISAWRSYVKLRDNYAFEKASSKIIQSFLVCFLQFCLAKNNSNKINIKKKKKMIGAEQIISFTTKQ